MAAGSTRGIGTAFAVLGAGLAVLGLIFAVAGKVPIGVSFLGSGVVFIVIGLASARKTTPPEDGAGTQRSAGRDGGRAD